MDDGVAAVGGFLAHRALIAFAAGAAMAEAGLLVAFAPAARALAPQVTAVPPLAVFHDLRWLYGAQRSWLEFTLLLAGLVPVWILVLVRIAHRNILLRGSSSFDNRPAPGKVPPGTDCARMCRNSAGHTSLGLALIRRLAPALAD